MAKPADQRRGFRVRTLLELEESDSKLLDKLTVRYQKLLGGKKNKSQVMRQLIRHAAKLEELPLVRE